MFSLKNIKITGEEASANQGRKFPDVIKKITEKKGYLPMNRFLLQIKVSYSGKKFHKEHLLLRKRSEYQDLKHKGIG